MKKIIIFLCLILAFSLLSGCHINISFGDKSKKEDKEYFDGVKDQNQNVQETINSNTSIEGTYLIAEDSFLQSSPYYSEEIGDSYIEFKSNHTFFAYLGFSNAIEGTYEIEGDTISCTATKFRNEYSPIQDISASFTFKKISDALLKVTSASESYHVKTTNLDEYGNWVYDGGSKDMPLTPFSNNTNYTLFTPNF